MQSKKTFGDYIRQKRGEAGFTQKTFAEKLYVTESAVSKWERGLSYPDISLIKDICELLNVSEHELLTASEDTQTRTNEKLANQYLKLIERFKQVQMLLYGIALLVCFVCNLAIQHTLSWFFIVLAAEILAATLTLLPVLVEKHRGLATLGAFTASLLLLLLVCDLYTGGGWFFLAAAGVLLGFSIVFLPFILAGIWLPQPWANHKALLCMAADTVLLGVVVLLSALYSGGGWFWSMGVPATAFWLTLPWGMLLILRYAKINGFFKAAGCLGLLSLVYYLSNGVYRVVCEGKSMTFGYPFDFTIWNAETVSGNVNMLFLFIALGLACAFALAGIAAALRNAKCGE